MMQVNRYNQNANRTANLASLTSIFAERPSSNVSERYGHISTADILNALMAEGFEIRSAQQQRVNADHRQGFQKHLIRLRHPDAGQTLEGLFPEVVLINSHDGSSSYQLMAGMYRLVCTNGLVVGDTFESIKVRHTPKAASEVIEASFKIIKELPEVTERVIEMDSIVLNDHERRAFARAALTLRYEDNDDGMSTAPIQPESLLRVRRSADMKPTLWNTFNVAQENLTKGGMKYQQGRRRQSVRKITGLDQDTRVNRALWTLAEALADHKAA
jgi:hypothetical protein